LLPGHVDHFKITSWQLGQRIACSRPVSSKEEHTVASCSQQMKLIEQELIQTFVT